MRAASPQEFSCGLAALCARKLRRSAVAGPWERSSSPKYGFSLRVSIHAIVREP